MAQITFKNVSISDFTLVDKSPQYSNKSWTGALIQRSTGVQWYEYQFTLSFNQSARNEVQQFLALHRQGKPFTMSMGHLSIYNGSQSGTVTSKANYQRGVYKVESNQAQTLEVGSMIQFANHKKLYTIVANTGSVLSLFPALQANVQIGETIFYNGLVIEGTLMPDNNYEMPVSNLVQMQFKCNEVIR
ncbi:hypothetical protein [Citrobacter sp. Igbk 16]|uniref:hypothetical protein n=1 Tax=Citrobacter sp. Igbk 16 TaxID=2963958 RepID=UPI0023020B03|nr:hypothetical protein [Citrobacter sp. Igbk 16]MDA8518961.1 hypothetical protein [Citrobacter sp. Igbk 16]